MTHRWQFVRAGGFDQVVIGSGADLENLGELDQKLWVALACPIQGVEFDERTLRLLDTDKDGRIRARELLAAVKWACEVVADPDDLVKGKDGMPLSAIDDESDEGKLLVATAKTLLASIGKGDAKKLTVAEVTKAVEGFDKQALNGDGIVPIASASDDTTKGWIKDVLACTATPEKDRGGEPGVSKATLDAFFEKIDAYEAWKARGREEGLRPFGDGTAAAYAAFTAVQKKVDDFFARVRVASFDARALAAINGEEKAYLELAAKDLDVTSAEIERLPIAHVAADAALPLVKGVNPAWAARLADLRAKVVQPKLGNKDALTDAEWRQLAALFVEHGNWAGKKAGVEVEKLGEPRITELAAPDVRKKLASLVEADLAKKDEAKAIESVEKIVRLYRDLIELVNNFVSFRDFYSRKAPAMFQVGTLYLDQRACELVVRVNDAGRHATMAPLANSYLLYCDCKNAKGETMQIAAAMTAGDVDNLMVGRNGVFYDRKGGDWDATVTKIIDNPISVRQAFWSPYKKVLRMIEERIAKRAADEQAAQDAALTTSVDSTQAAAGAAATGDAPSQIARPRGFDIGTVAALGVAVGGITAALGALLQAFFGLGIWMPLGIVGLVLCISGPSMAVAWLKLRRRNLGPILDANGWAVNAQAVVNVPLGGSLTKVAELPKNSSLSMTDPFAEEKKPWGFYLFVVALLAIALGWVTGSLDRFLPEPARASTVLHLEGDASEGASEGTGTAPPATTTP
ncbi:MAG: hypothetical protein U0234_30550 [Sandaracinus sp.]